MSTEDQDILAKISRLKGQIDRHKHGHEQQSPRSSPYQVPQSSFPPRTWSPSRGSYRGRPYARGGRNTQLHRNKTLVLNGATPSTSADKTTNNDNTTESAAASTPTGSSTPAWVTKTDRHLQLINPAIFEKQSQERAKAIEETRKLKLKQRDERERAKLSKHLQRLAAAPPVGQVQGSPYKSSSNNYEIAVHGIRFRVVKNGSKLIKVPGRMLPIGCGNCDEKFVKSGLQDKGDENLGKTTPKTAIVGGVRFYRSKNGNLYRSGIVKAQRRNGIIKKINEPCKIFSTTGTCPKGPRCRYIHDPNKVAVCKDFLQKGACPAGDSCDLSHDLTPERTPMCVHFAKGNCSNENCRYSHIHVSPTAPVCRSFGIYGYCDKGASCAERHVNECPDYSNTGVCKTKGCKLLHRDKASNLRKNNAAHTDQPDNDETSDLSSDDEADAMDSDDIDSDEVDEEFFGEDDGEQDPAITGQQDFVHI